MAPAGQEPALQPKGQLAAVAVGSGRGALEPGEGDAQVGARLLQGAALAGRG